MTDNGRRVTPQRRGLYWLFNWQYPWLLYLMVVAGWAAALLVYQPAAVALEPPPAA